MNEPADPALSSFSTSTYTIRTDGVDVATLVVTARDRCGNFLPDRPVTLISSRPGADVISPLTGTTDFNGQFMAVMSSTVASPMNDQTGASSASSLTAQVDGVTLYATLSVAFRCVDGVALGFTNPLDVQYYLLNFTPEDRVLETLTLTWPSGSSRALTEVSLYPPLEEIWTGSIMFSPLFIDIWPSPPASRTVSAASDYRYLRAEFNVDLATIPGAPNNGFMIETQWKDEATGRVCTSDPITVLR
jgi:hypothetical protein